MMFDKKHILEIEKENAIREGKLIKLEKKNLNILKGFIAILSVITFFTLFTSALIYSSGSNVSMWFLISILILLIILIISLIAIEFRLNYISVMYD